MTARKFVPRPDTVIVGFQTYTIEYASVDEWDAQRRPEEAAGVTHADQASIVLLITPNLDENKLRERVLHEITHAVWASNNMTHLVTMDGGLPDDVEESIVLMQSTALLQVMRDNPEVVKYLTAKDR